MFACCGSKKKSKITASVDETQDNTKSQSYSSPHMRHPHKSMTEVSKMKSENILNTFKSDMNRDRSEE